MKRVLRLLRGLCVVVAMPVLMALFLLGWLMASEDVRERIRQTVDTMQKGDVHD